MLNRHNSMTLHQPIMPFKWRPFDLYNDIHINRANDNNNPPKVRTTSAPTTNSNCARCHSNCDDFVLWTNFRKHRQSSRGSSSDGSSCTSLSTTNHCIGETDSNLSTGKSTHVSPDYYSKFVGKHYESNHDKLKCAHHQLCTGRSNARFNDATINCCCGSNHPNITSNCKAMVHDNTFRKLLNRIVAMPIEHYTEQTTTNDQLKYSSNGCEKLPKRPVSSNTPLNNINKQYYRNNSFVYGKTINRSKSFADSKYLNFLLQFIVGYRQIRI